jgi:hypothetical protein
LAQVVAAVLLAMVLLEVILPLVRLLHHLVAAAAAKVPHQVRRVHLAVVVVIKLRQAVQEFLGKALRVAQVQRQLNQVGAVVVDQVRLVLRLLQIQQVTAVQEQRHQLRVLL